LNCCAESSCLKRPRQIDQKFSIGCPIPQQIVSDGICSKCKMLEFECSSADTGLQGDESRRIPALLRSIYQIHSSLFDQTYPQAIQLYFKPKDSANKH
jgi:hypothetical protein